MKLSLNSLVRCEPVCDKGGVLKDGG